MNALHLWAVACAVAFLAKSAQGQITFDFDSAPVHTPLPLDQTVAGLTAHLSSSLAGANYSVQTANVLGFTPAGFAGNCIYPDTIDSSDLLISFSQPLSSISILYAPEEYATDSSCTMRITAYFGQNQVGTSTTIIDPPGTWPTGTLSLSSGQPFQEVVIHYDKPPATGGDYGPIFMVDNLVATPVPEPRSTAVVVLTLTAIAAAACRHSAPKLVAHAACPLALRRTPKRHSSR